MKHLLCADLGHKSGTLGAPTRFHAQTRNSTGKCDSLCQVFDPGYKGCGGTLGRAGEGGTVYLRARGKDRKDGVWRGCRVAC